ncbi:MAG: hypothetical protein M3348_04740 [Acidobacteriota bacterium]|nr:hypothetical protein [Acidobacteriota bacterium]
MKKSKKTVRGRSAAKRGRAFRAAAFASVLLALGAVTAIARYESNSAAPQRATAQSAAPAQKPAGGFVTVEVGGKTLRVNPQTLQQGPLTQEQSQAIADALKGNKSTEGLVEVKHADGSVEMDLQGRFQNVTLAKRNDDGSVSAACVDSPEAASAFLQSRETTTTLTRPNRKAALQQ